MPTHDKGAILHQMWKRPAPARALAEGRTVRSWVDDGQDGGWIEWVTPEEAAYREEEQHREDERREENERRARVEREQDERGEE